MKVMVIVKATKNGEAGVMPSEKLLTEMGRYNEDLVKAGHHAGGRRTASEREGQAHQVRRDAAPGDRRALRGTKELIAGYWIWQVSSMEEAVEWARRCPDPMPGEDAELELRPLFELEDFGKEPHPRAALEGGEAPRRSRATEEVVGAPSKSRTLLITRRAR
ncbi:MAG: YciI family protein [Gammaproteobacteria bacterium]